MSDLVKVFNIPAEQAVKQNKKPAYIGRVIEQSPFVRNGTPGAGFIIEKEDGTFAHVMVEQCQRVQEDTKKTPPRKLAVKKPTQE